MAGGKYWGTFTQPMLPKEFYKAFRQLQGDHKVKNQWHMLLVAIQALIHLNEEEPKLVQGWVAKVQDKYPFPWKPKVGLEDPDA